MIPRDIKASAVKIVGSTPDDVQFESVLEEDYLFLVRFDHTVKKYKRVTDPIKWVDPDGGEHSYTPDFQIEFHPDDSGKRRRSVVVEVKPDFADEPDPFSHKANLPRKPQPHERLMWSTAKKHYQRVEMEFKVVREAEIRIPRLKNALLLLPYLERPEERPPKKDIELVLRHLEQEGPCTLRQVANALAETLARRAEVLRSCYFLIAKRRIRVDLDQLLHFESLLEVVHGVG